MKSQLNTWKFRTAVCLIALVLQAGCANKTNVAENEQVDGFAELGEKPADSIAADQSSEAADTNATESELFGEKPASADDSGANLAQNDPGSAPNTGDQSMETLFAPNQDPNASADPNFAELTGNPPASEPTLTDTSLAPLDGTDPALADASLAPAGSTDPLVNADPLAEESNSMSALQDPTTPTEVPAPSENPVLTETKAKVAVVAPKIPGRAMTRKGISLNRYYFLRQGDTSKSVSSLLYGDASHSTSLKKWNKGNWIAGKVIYYQSATQADDAQMISFYDERGLTPQDHRVAKGETMSGIAKKMLGNRSSWKEIAVVNGLTRPGGLQRGQTLKIFTDLRSPVASPVEVADAAPEVVEPVMPQTAPTPVPEVALAPEAPATAVAPMEVPPVNDELSKPKKKTAKQSVSLGKLISQNSFALAMGLGIGLLLIALMMLNKRKKGGSGADEFSEDAFAAPEKKKRR